MLLMMIIGNTYNSGTQYIMNDQEQTIASLRKQLQDALKKVSALEQEVSLLKYQLEAGGNKANPSIVL